MQGHIYVLLSLEQDLGCREFVCCRLLQQNFCPREVFADLPAYCRVSESRSSNDNYVGIASAARIYEFSVDWEMSPAEGEHM